MAMAHRVRPAAATTERTLPVDDALRGLFPSGLPRGVTSVVSGDAARSLAFTLAAAATRTGSWLAMIGLGDAGWRAVAEAGVEMSRVVHVDVDAAAATGRTADCVAAALDGFDLVVIGSRVRLATGVERRLAARARERGSVLVGVHEPPVGATHHRSSGPLGTIADLRVTTRRGRWHGLGTGTGHLTGRQVEVLAEGRRLPGRRHRTRLWLPGPDGTPAPVAGTGVGPTPIDGRSPEARGVRPVGRSA